MTSVYSYLTFFWQNVNLKVNTVFLIAYIAGLSVVILIFLQPYVPIEELTRDTVALTKGKVYFGLISNLGLFMWCASATLCLFTFFLIRNNAPRRQRYLLLGGAFISALLLLDDFLLLHEAVFPLSFGISEKYILAVYPILIAAYISFFLKEIIRTQCLLFFSSLGLLMLSMISDNLFAQFGPVIIIEDGLKFLGITGWFLYFFHLCTDVVKRNYTFTSKFGKKGVEREPVPLYLNKMAHKSPAKSNH